MCEGQSLASGRLGWLLRLPCGSYHGPFLWYPLVGLGICSHKVGYPNQGVLRSLREGSSAVAMRNNVSCLSCARSAWALPCASRSQTIREAHSGASSSETVYLLAKNSASSWSITLFRSLRPLRWTSPRPPRPPPLTWCSLGATKHFAAQTWTCNCVFAVAVNPKKLQQTRRTVWRSCLEATTYQNQTNSRDSKVAWTMTDTVLRCSCSAL